MRLYVVVSAKTGSIEIVEICLSEEEQEVVYKELYGSGTYTSVIKRTVEVKGVVSKAMADGVLESKEVVERMLRERENEVERLRGNNRVLFKEKRNLEALNDAMRGLLYMLLQPSDADISGSTASCHSYAESNTKGE